MSTVNKDPYAEKVFENKKITIGTGEINILALLTRKL